jgi:hypothetical protein
MEMIIIMMMLMKIVIVIISTSKAVGRLNKNLNLKYVATDKCLRKVISSFPVASSFYKK